MVYPIYNTIDTYLEATSKKSFPHEQITTDL